MAFLFSKPADTPGSAVPAVIIGMFVAFGGVLCKSCLCGFSILRTDSDVIQQSAMIVSIQSPDCAS